MGTSRGKIVGLILGWIMLLGMVSTAAAHSFVAQMITVMEGKTEANPFYFKDSAYRFDTEQGGARGYFLFRKNDKFMTFVVSDKKGYMRAPRQASIFMKNNLFEFRSGGFMKHYKLASKTHEKVGSLKCTKETYTIEGASGPMKVLEAWISNKYNFPIKVVTYYKGKERARAELKDIEEKELDASLFTIPAGYRELKPSEVASGEKPKKRTQWLKGVKSAPVLTPPFEKTFHEGDIVRVKLRQNYSVTFEMESPGRNRDQWAHVEYFAFKNGKKIKNLGEYGGFSRAEFKKPPEGADEIVIRVLKRSPKIRVLTAPSNVIEAVTIKGPGTKMFSSFHFASAKKPGIILEDDPKDGISSLGEISVYKGRKAVIKQKYHLRNGTSKSWDLSKFGKKISAFVSVKKGKIEVRIEEATAAAPESTASTNQIPVSAKPKAKPKAKPRPSGISYGQWRVRRFLVMSGLPKPMPAGDWEMCLNEKNVIPLVEVQYPICKFKRREVKGTAVYFDFTLRAGEQKLRYEGEAMFSGDKLHGKYVLHTEEGTKATYKFEGERQGKCE